MHIAFYAPMKSPNHARPSGDRRIARLLIKAIESTGHSIEIMSELRAWEGRGNHRAQQQICAQAKRISERIIKDLRARPQKPDIWFSYHLYHKAPDWIGPRVAAELNIPYVVAEASYAPKQAQGAWSTGLAQVTAGLAQAAAIVCLNPRDVPALERLPASKHKTHRLQPFLELENIDPKKATVNRKQIAQQYQLDPALPWLACVAMMRDDAKLRSYENLAKTLARVKQPCQLLIIGDGRARSQVETLFSGKLSETTRYAGQLDQIAILQALAACDLFVWPAVNEAIGMAILEAQACGLAAVVGKSGAIEEIVRHGQTGYVCVPDDARNMARHIDQLLEDSCLRQRFSVAAEQHIRKHHSMLTAASSLDTILRSVQHTRKKTI